MCILTIKIFDDDKKSYLYDRFFVSNLNYCTEHLKIDENSRFFQIFCSKFQVFQSFFSINCQIPDFSKFKGKLATLKP